MSESKSKEYKLELIKGNSYMIAAGVFSVGVYVTEQKAAILIDSGIDQAMAKKIDVAIKTAGYNVAAIINTHCHGDHCGGNEYFQKNIKNLKIYATRSERAFIEDPRLLASCFCCGAAPIKEICVKQVVAKPSEITDLIVSYKDQKIKISDAELEIVTLPGHSHQHIGVKTSDNVLYSGDAILGPDIFKKHGVPLFVNIADSLSTFAKMKKLNCDSYVLYHGGILKDIQELLGDHEKKLQDIKDFMLSKLTSSPMTRELLTQAVAEHYAVKEDPLAISLAMSTVMACLTQLQIENKIKVYAEAHLERYGVNSSKENVVSSVSPK